MQKSFASLGPDAWPFGRSSSAPSPPSIPEWLQAALDWLSHTDRIAALFALLALVVAVWSSVITRRGVRAADRSAHAAEAQAEAATAQAFDAGRQASTARVTGEVEALAAAKSRIDAASPSVVVAITTINRSPYIARSLYDVQCPHPEAAKVEGDRYVKWADWHFDVYFVITGTLFNDGAQAVRAYANGPRYYAGRHPLTGEELREPPVCDPAWDARVLYPGQFASFQLFVGQQVWDWLDALDSKPEGSESELRDIFVFRPGGSDEPSVSAIIKTKANPLVRVAPEHPDARVGDLKARVRPICHVNVQVEYFKEYPDSLDQVHAELRNDKDELRSLYWRSQIARSLKEDRERIAREGSGRDDNDHSAYDEHLE
ncbi:hypothetical protein [Micromonospora lupini]|uniref:hypothetical protein n=1 Tax=Micromonospora lupini TaxID=285679 RepID=UPI0033F3A98B